MNAQTQELRPHIILLDLQMPNTTAALEERATTLILTFSLEGEGTWPPLPLGEGWGEGNLCELRL